MQISNAILLGLGLISSAHARPSNVNSVQSVQMVFTGATASYTLQIPTDGSVVPTNNDLSIDTIDSNNFDAFHHCTFVTAHNGQLVFQDGSDGVQTITVGPPQPVNSVSCQSA
ncbi:hypothetical protein GGR50DRAFT_694140 [Xylaria sp. CBS 124048]|nr:hypothetical protein GGR50DRAFT_694140 [Xylaria sp. CBS 124048]